MSAHPSTRCCSPARPRWSDSPRLGATRSRRGLACGLRARRDRGLHRCGVRCHHHDQGVQPGLVPDRPRLGSLLAATSERLSNTLASERLAETARHNSDAPLTARIEVQRTIAASSSEIFRVLRDPKGHVAIDSSGMLMGATGEAVSASASASRFTWTVKRSTTTPSARTTSRSSSPPTTRSRDRLDDRRAAQAAHRPRLRVPARARRQRQHGGDLVLRLVGHPPGMGWTKHLPGPERGGVAGDVGHPRQDGRTRRPHLNRAHPRRQLTDRPQSVSPERAPRARGGPGPSLTPFGRIVLSHAWQRGPERSRGRASGAPHGSVVRPRDRSRPCPGPAGARRSSGG